MVQRAYGHPISDTPERARIVVAARDEIGSRARQLVLSLPLRPMDLDVISEIGEFIAGVVATGMRDDVAAIALVDRGENPAHRRRLAHDAATVLRRTRKPVLLAVGECPTETGGSLLVAMEGCARPAETVAPSVEAFSDLSAAEVVVLSVAKPFHPLFSRVAIGMRSERRTAIRQIHEAQVCEAETDALRLCENLRNSGAKAWAVGRVGRFVSELAAIVRSSGCSLVCVPLGESQAAQERRTRSLLDQLLERVETPVLLLPVARR